MLYPSGHHAYCIVGPREENTAALLGELERSGVALRGNPDFRVDVHALFGIGEARALAEASARAALGSGKKIFVVAADGMTREAQNAFLKTAEEPSAGTVFFLLVPSAQMLLPTLRSRLLLIFPSSDTRPVSLRAADFLAQPPRERLKTVQKLLKTPPDGDARRSECARFLDELERGLSQKDRRRFSDALREILFLKRYARDRAPSFKLILEHLAVVLPRV